MTQHTSVPFTTQLNLSPSLVDDGALLSDAKHWSSSSDQWSKSIIAKRQPSKMKTGFNSYSPVHNFFLVFMRTKAPDK